MKEFSLRCIFLPVFFICTGVAHSLVPETSQYCNSVQNKALKLLANDSAPNFSNDLIDLSANNPIDDGCYRWQLVLINSLKALPTQPAGFRTYLFNRMSIEKVIPDYVLLSLQYATSQGQISDEEWLVIKTYLASASEDFIRSVILVLVSSQYESDETIQSRAGALFELAKNNTLGLQDGISLSRAIELFLHVTAEQRPNLFAAYYQKYFYLLDEQSNMNLSKQAVRFFNRNQDALGLEFLSTYINNAKLSAGMSREFFLLLLKLHKGKAINPFYAHVVNAIVKDHPAKVRGLIEQANLSNKRKDLLKIEYDLDHIAEYKITDYASQLFSEKLRDQKLAAEYLVAFGKRANVVKYDVQSKLMRIKDNEARNSSAKLIVSLLKVLTHIEASDKETLEFMIWALASRDHKISKQAFIGLTSIGAAALPEYIQNFQLYPAEVQQLIVEVMASFESGHLPTIKFLSQIKPRNDKIRYAVDDAVAELNDF